jgi:hypothetical protein
MGGDFNWATTATQSVLTVDPQKLLVGDYVLHFKICLLLYPA